MKQSLRVFIAVELNDVIRRRAKEIIAKLQNDATPVKWTEPENMHITLQFLGQIPLQEALQVCAEVEKAVRNLPPFQIVVRGV